jgi:DNA-binding response OmpR family regulator
MQPISQPDPERTRGELAPESQRTLRQYRRALRLLIVDDDDDFRSLLGDVLKLKGVTALEARDGEQALRCIEAGPPDAVLLDHRMPGLLGTEVVEELRARGISVPIILMTAADSVRELAGAAGVTHWIGKPFTLDQLQGVLELALFGEAASRRGSLEDPSR